MQSTRRTGSRRAVLAGLFLALGLVSASPVAAYPTTPEGEPLYLEQSVPGTATPVGGAVPSTAGAAAAGTAAGAGLRHERDRLGRSRPRGRHCRGDRRGGTGADRRRIESDQPSPLGEGSLRREGDDARIRCPCPAGARPGSTRRPVARRASCRSGYARPGRGRNPEAEAAPVSPALQAPTPPGGRWVMSPSPGCALGRSPRPGALQVVLVAVAALGFASCVVGFGLRGSSVEAPGDATVQGRRILAPPRVPVRSIELVATVPLPGPPTGLAVGRTQRGCLDGAGRPHAAAARRRPPRATPPLRRHRHLDRGRRSRILVRRPDARPCRTSRRGRFRRPSGFVSAGSPAGSS